jgi:hypothetical protein
MVSIEDSRRILHAIFPNYPELKPCNPVPTLEPTASPVRSFIFDLTYSNSSEAGLMQADKNAKSA